MTAQNLIAFKPIYKDIPGHPGYRAGSDGSLWFGPVGGRLNPSRWERLEPTRNAAGYDVISTTRDGKESQFRVHRLILEAFVGPCPDGQEACHNNGVRDDNRVCNLRWDTHAGNMADAVKHGTMARGSRSPVAKLDGAKVRRIRSMYNAGRTLAEIAEHFGVDRSVVGRVVNYKTWKHI